MAETDLMALERLLSKLEFDPNSGCWLWSTPTVVQGGYGRFGWRKKNWLAHRASFTLHRGPIPDGMDVLHSCDTPPCCNPDHLYPGDDAANVADKMARGRYRHGVHYFGEANVVAKLTADQVVEIRRICVNRAETWDSIGARFGVSPSAVYLIHKRVNWRHIPG